MKDIALKVLKTLISHGYEAYIVGGFVRDFLLGEDNPDIDITTDATPEQVMSLFDHVIPTGIKHGTVTVVLKNKLVEITTFRSDGKYKDGRRPESVRYSKSIKEDLSRRDFTINSFLLDSNFELIDYLEARDDLDNQLIKTIGRPSRRFKEDALRMLRAIRFVSKLGFEIDKETMDAIYDNKELLRKVSIERVKHELAKIFEGKYYLMAKGLLEQLRLPRIDFRYPKVQLSEVEMYSILSVENCFDVSMWKFSNNEKVFINNVCELLGSDYNLFLLYKIANIEEYFNVIEYFEGTDVVEQLKSMVPQLPIRSRNDIVINGNDIMELGFDGIMIGEIISALEWKIVFNELDNNKEVLLDYIRRNYDKNKRVN